MKLADIAIVAFQYGESAMQANDLIEESGIIVSPRRRHSHFHAQESPPPSSGTWPSPGQLPTLRKRPNQSRSRALVDAVAQACLRILDEEGDEALTVARIAEVSGAAVGSIYQYFPNKDAIVAMLYERVLDQESEQLLLVRERLVGMPLTTALREILANIIRVELRLFKLNQAFHLRHHAALHLGMWRGPYRTANEFIEATWLPLLQMYEPEVSTPHPALAAYLLGQGLRSVIRSVLEDIPAQLESPALLDSLVAMAVGCLRPAESCSLSESSMCKSSE